MPGKFISPDGDLETMFVDDYAMIDQYAMTGSMWGWGANNIGQIGDNTVVDKSSPVQTAAGGNNWKQVSTYASCTAAIKTDGTLWLWGANNIGQLGDNTTVNKSSPVQTVAGGNNWKHAAAGGTIAAAIKTDGTLWTWGGNNTGALGDNTTVDKSSPVQTISGGTNWKQIACSFNVVAAIKTDGTLWNWGSNTSGELGDNTIVSKSSPVQTVAGGNNWKTLGRSGGAAIKTDGTLWVWGTNYYSQLGIGSGGGYRSSPVQTVAAGTNWKSHTSGNGGHTAAIKTDGTLWIWGRNNGGQLGDNTRTLRNSPVQTIAGGTNWKQVNCGYTFTIATKTDGTLWTWGTNYLGQLGINVYGASKSSPVQTVSGGTNWKQIAGGSNNVSAIYFYDAGNLYPSA